MPEWDPREIEPLIARLESEDFFDRLEAIEALEARTKRTFGYRFNAPLAERAEAVRRWKAWWREELLEREREKNLKAAIHLSGGMLDLGMLKKALTEIPPEKIQGYLSALISKLKSQQQLRCEACHSRPATVRVTEIDHGTCRTRLLCEICARERGDVVL